MDTIKQILNTMTAILDQKTPEQLLLFVPYQTSDLEQYYQDIAPNDTMGFILICLENWFYQAENRIKQENKNVFEFWQNTWEYDLFEQVEPAFYTDEPERWQIFLNSMQQFVHQTQKILDNRKNNNG